MVVVDTSVRVDVLNENDAPRPALCISLLRDGASLALTDVILTRFRRPSICLQPRSRPG